MGGTHHGKGIEAAIERPDGIDPAAVGFNIKCRADKTFTGRMGNKPDFAACSIGKGGGLYPVRDGGRHFFGTKIGPHWAFGLRKAAADITGKTARTGNHLRKFDRLRCERGIHTGILSISVVFVKPTVFAVQTFD